MEGGERKGLVSSPPRVRLLVRTKEEGSSVSFFPEEGESNSEGGSMNFPPMRSDVVTMSKDGSKFLGVNLSGEAVVIESTTGKELCHFGKDVTQVAFSPLGTYAMTWCRPSVSPNANFCVWNATTGENIASFSRKDFVPQKWPYVQWSDDEKLACRPVTNEVHFFDGDQVGGSIKFKIRVEKVEFIALSRGKEPYRLATFSPATKSLPAKASLYKVPSGEIISTRSMFRADQVIFQWNKSGSAVLGQVTSDVDSTGRSYYGESNLIFMDVNSKYDQRVELPKNGPTYDAQWVPRGNPQFVVVYGSQPARATLFNDKCEPVFEFGSGSWNCINFSPHGRFLALCGFQSLSGDVDFWDRVEEKLVGRAKMTHTTSFSWSACSRYVVASSTFPRLRVDNGYKVFSYDGRKLKEVNYKGYLLQAEFLPAPLKTYPDRPASPKPPGWEAKQEASGGKVVDLSKVTEKRVYRPPGARGAQATFSLRDDDETYSAGKVSSLISTRRQTHDEIPGLHTEEETLTKNQIRNRKKKKAQEEKKKLGEAAAKEEEEKRALQRTAREEDDELTTQKELRALKKKLRRAIEKKEGKELTTEEATLTAVKISDLEKEISAVEKRLLKLQLDG